MFESGPLNGKHLTSTRLRSKSHFKNAELCKLKSHLP